VIERVCDRLLASEWSELSSAGNHGCLSSEFLVARRRAVLEAPCPFPKFPKSIDLLEADWQFLRRFGLDAGVVRQAREVAGD